MGEVGDALLGTAALGDVLVGRAPAAIRERLVHDLHGAAVGRFDDGDLAPADLAQRGLDIFVRVADEGARLLPVLDDLAETGPRPDDVAGVAKQLEVAMGVENWRPRRQDAAVDECTDDYEL